MTEEGREDAAAVESEGVEELERVVVVKRIIVKAKVKKVMKKRRKKR